MPVPRAGRWKKLPTKKAASHQATSMAHKLCHPFQVLGRPETELKLNVVEKVKDISAE